MPLYIFVDALVDDKIHGIVVSGSPTEKEIGDAWTELQMQYNEAMGDNESRLFFSLHKQILQKEVDLKQVDLALIALKGIPTPSGYFVPENVCIEKLVTFLNGLFFTTIQLDTQIDYEEYVNRLNVFRNMKASIKMNMDLKRLQYEAIRKKRRAQSQKPDRSYFQMTLLNLSDYSRYEVDDKITTFSYCSRMQRMIKYLDSKP